jgi:putative transposase
MTRACQALGLSRATVYRYGKPTSRVGLPRRTSHRRLSDAERGEVLTLLDSERFVDQPPREVYATLLEQGQYLCSPRTMYRILHNRGAVRERRDHCERQIYAVPRLVATAPNQVWTWDISKLATLVKGVFLNLYVILDLFSRYVVAWMIAEHENSALAKQLFAEAITRYGIEPGTLLVHMDRGAPMTAIGLAELLCALGVDKSHSRPRVSNDNPFSESHFHTVKYQPDYPGRFRDIRHARRWFEDFFTWYNEQHHHEGLSQFTPADVYWGRTSLVAQHRLDALQTAYLRHPERFVRGAPFVRLPPARVELNPLDPGEPMTAQALLLARDAELSALGTTTPRPSTAPVIHLPGVHGATPGAATPQPLST